MPAELNENSHIPENKQTQPCNLLKYQYFSQKFKKKNTSAPNLP